MNMYVQQDPRYSLDLFYRNWCLGESFTKCINLPGWPVECTTGRKEDKAVINIASLSIFCVDAVLIYPQVQLSWKRYHRLPVLLHCSSVHCTVPRETSHYWMTVITIDWDWHHVMMMMDWLWQSALVRVKVPYQANSEVS